MTTWLVRKTPGEEPEILATRETWTELEEYMQQTSRLYGPNWAHDLSVIDGFETKIKCETSTIYSFWKDET